MVSPTIPFIENTVVLPKTPAELLAEAQHHLQHQKQQAIDFTNRRKAEIDKAVNGYRSAKRVAMSTGRDMLKFAGLLGGIVLFMYLVGSPSRKADPPSQPVPQPAPVQAMIAPPSSVPAPPKAPEVTPSAIPLPKRPSPVVNADLFQRIAAFHRNADSDAPPQNALSSLAAVTGRPTFRTETDVEEALRVATSRAAAMKPYVNSFPLDNSVSQALLAAMSEDDVLLLRTSFGLVLGDGKPHTLRGELHTKGLFFEASVTPLDADGSTRCSFFSITLTRGAFQETTRGHTCRWPDNKDHFFYPAPPRSPGPFFSFW